MFLLLNGSFGIGKTTVANALAGELRGAAVYDPEHVGYILRRVPAWALGLSRRPSDYQDMPLWRRLIAGGARRAHRHSPFVIVPMAFTNRQYLADLASALEPVGPVHKLCLIAPLETVQSRLRQRAAREGRAVTEFETRRSTECITAHPDPIFGTPIDASGPVTEIVAAIRKAVGQ